MIASYLSLIIFLVINLFFGYHNLYGPRGWHYYCDMQKSHTAMLDQLQSLKNQKKALKQKIVLLGSNIDADVLSKQAWNVAGYTHPKNVVIFYKDNE